MQPPIRLTQPLSHLARLTLIHRFTIKANNWYHNTGGAGHKHSRSFYPCSSATPFRWLHVLTHSQTSGFSRHKIQSAIQRAL